MNVHFEGGGPIEVNYNCREFGLGTSVAERAKVSCNVRFIYCRSCEVLMMMILVTQIFCWTPDVLTGLLDIDVDRQRTRRRELGHSMPQRRILWLYAKKDIGAIHIPEIHAEFRNFRVSAPSTVMKTKQ